MFDNYFIVKSLLKSNVARVILLADLLTYLITNDMELA